MRLRASASSTAPRPGHLAALAAMGQVPLRYASADGEVATGFPHNPNGAEESAAAVCNEAGNVLAIMPHPERAQDLLAMSRSSGGNWGERREAALEDEHEGAADGPGLALFRGLAAALEER